MRTSKQQVENKQKTFPVTEVKRSFCSDERRNIFKKVGSRVKHWNMNIGVLFFSLLSMK